MKKFLILCLCFLPTYLFAEIPQPWQTDWDNPKADQRPMQIIHGYFGVNKDKWKHSYLPFGHFDGMSIADGMKMFKEQCGLGGVVCNVSSYRYLQDEEQWALFVEAVRQAKANGLRVWIYDEDRYPSFAAGGLLLKEHPEWEAKELVYDETLPDPFQVRDCFEFTLVSNNSAYIRRYPSIVNPKAGQEFIRLTHENYKKHLGPELFAWVEAFFTDEPSSNAMNNGLMDKWALQRVPKIDQINPDKKNLPMVVWSEDFPEIYRQRYGEDLMPVRKSLFTGDSQADRKVRRQFWEMVTQRQLDAYYGAIAKWCDANGKKSSGHTLWEGGLYMHTPLDGNKLEVLRSFQIPGMDYYTSHPDSVFMGWRDATLAASAAALSGKRKVFTEISDIAEVYFQLKKPASVSLMNMTAAWQAIFGITEFALYYQLTDRTPADYKAYSEFVGRTNAILRDASFVRDVVVLYPIRDLNELYIPSKDCITSTNIPKGAQTICRSYLKIGGQMLRSQTTFLLAEEKDLPNLLAGKIPGLNVPRAILILEGATVTDETQKRLDAFEKSGGTVFRATFTPLESYLSPASKQVFRGEYVRDGYQVQIFLNTSKTDSYQGNVRVRGTSGTLLSPEDGKIEPAVLHDGSAALNLQPWETKILVTK